MTNNSEPKGNQPNQPDATETVTAVSTASNIAGTAREGTFCQRHLRRFQTAGYVIVILAFAVFFVVKFAPTSDTADFEPFGSEPIIVDDDTPILDPNYIPGLLTNRESGLVLSSGLTARVIAESGKPAQVHEVLEIRGSIRTILSCSTRRRSLLSRLQEPWRLDLRVELRGKS